MEFCEEIYKKISTPGTLGYLLLYVGTTTFWICFTIALGLSESFKHEFKNISSFQEKLHS
jgi:hypothetical protein